jgi:hypothetical protein
MQPVMLTENELREIAEVLAKYYPFKAEEIFTVMLQTKSIDATAYIVHYCTEEALKLDYGVYCYLKHRDSRYERY